MRIQPVRGPLALFAAMASILMFLATACHSDNAHGRSSAQHHMHRQNFDELVKHFEDPAREAWQKPKAVVALIGSHMRKYQIKSPVIADLGAGSGYFSFRLLDAGYGVKALDLDAKFVAHLQKRAASHARREKLEIRQVTPESANLQDGEVDAIISVDVYHHIENRVAYFQRLKKSLRGKNPLLVIIDFKDGEQPVGPPPHIKVPTATIIAELSEAGYTVNADSTTLPYQTIFLARPGK